MSFFFPGPLNCVKTGEKYKTSIRADFCTFKPEMTRAALKQSVILQTSLYVTTLLLGVKVLAFSEPSIEVINRVLC